MLTQAVEIGRPRGPFILSVFLTGKRTAFVVAFLIALPFVAARVAAQQPAGTSPPPSQQEEPQAAAPAPAPAAAAQIPVAAPAAPRIALKDKYRAVEVGEFDVAEKVNFPAKLVRPLHDDLVKEFGNWDKIQLVRVPETATALAEPVLRLTGTVIAYDKGDRAERYIGFGGGAAQVTVHVTFRDASSGATVLAAQIIATLTGGLFGGGEGNITHEFARTCVTTTKLLLEKPVPSESESALAESVTSALGAERKIVAVVGEHMDQSQADLNSQAAAGYRVVAFTPTAVPSAEIAMERTETPSEVYQYRLIHVHQPGNMQGDLNAAAAQGFRYVPRSLAWLSGGFGGFFVAVVEKPPVPSLVEYRYRVHAPMQVSNAQKDIARDQRENFNLVGTLERPNVHVVLLEQLVTEAGEQKQR